MSEKVLIRLYARTSVVGSTVERTVTWDDAEDWEHLSDREKEDAMLDELWNQSLVEWGWHVIE